MIDGYHLEHDCDGTTEQWFLILDDDFGTYRHVVDPERLDEALRGWRMHMLEGEIVRREREAAVADDEMAESWAGYVEMRSRDDPEWAEALRYAGDVKRKMLLENGDPGDETRAA